MTSKTISTTHTPHSPNPPTTVATIVAFIKLFVQILNDELHEDAMLRRDSSHADDDALVLD